MVNGSRGLGGWAGPSWICLSPEPPGQERMGGWEDGGGQQVPSQDQTHQLKCCQLTTVHIVYDTEQSIEVCCSFFKCWIRFQFGAEQQ